jgi:hypothetical protein
MVGEKGDWKEPGLELASSPYLPGKLQGQTGEGGHGLENVDFFGPAEAMKCESALSVWPRGHRSHAGAFAGSPFPAPVHRGAPFSSAS